MTRGLLALVFLLVPAGAGAQMYKCKNERGGLQYSDKPCPGGSKGGEVDIQGQPPISGKLTPYKEDLKRSEADFQRREKQREREFAAQARIADNEKRRCDNFREQLARAQSMRKPANAEAHDANIARLQAEVAKCR